MEVLDTNTIGLNLNEQTKQQSNIGALIWDIPHIIHHLSRYFTLKVGDLTFTGTPSGVGSLKKGDMIEAYIQGLDRLEVRVL